MNRPSWMAKGLLIACLVLSTAIALEWTLLADRVVEAICISHHQMVEQQAVIAQENGDWETAAALFGYLSASSDSQPLRCSSANVTGADPLLPAFALLSVRQNERSNARARAEVPGYPEIMHRRAYLRALRHLGAKPNVLSNQIERITNAGFSGDRDRAQEFIKAGGR